MHLVYRTKFYITIIVSSFSSVLQLSLEKSKTMVAQNSGGEGVDKVHYGLDLMNMVNRIFETL